MFPILSRRFAALGVFVCVCCPALAAADPFVFRHENVMGTSMELRVQADSAESAHAAEARVLAEIDRLSAIFSGYDARSEFSRWQAGPAGPVKIAPELFEVLEACDHWRAASEGAFDPRVESLMRLWARCARENRLPTPAERTAAQAAIHQPAWRLDSASLTAERLSDAPVTLNAIAKGYIVEKACNAGFDRQRGVRGLLLQVGGDLRGCGELSRTISVADPHADSETSPPIATVEVKDRAVSTSGNSQRGFRIESRWYSHKLDPRTGAPVERVACVTVIAERSADADALATIFNVLPPDQSVRFAQALPGVECLIVASDGRVTRSDGWKLFETTLPALGTSAILPGLGFPRLPQQAATVNGPRAANPAQAPSKTWSDEFEVLVKFEINGPGGDARRYRRPYVAVWVEDKDGFPVRTLTLWLQAKAPGPRWFPDLKRWYRSDQARRLVDESDLIATVARPTRPPGAYDVIWDGKDDQGKPVEPGQYTLYLEAAREHGTYQSIKKPITLGTKPFDEDLKGNAEIKSASVACRRKGSAK